MTRWQKLGFYASAIPLGLISAIVFPKNTLLAIGFVGAFMGALSFLWAYRFSLALWLCTLTLAAIHFVLLYKLNIAILPQMQRGASIGTILAIILVDGVGLYFVMKTCMNIMRIVPISSAKT